MCGRYALGLTRREISERFGFEEIDERRPPALPLPLFNIAPSRSVPTIVETDGGRELRMMTWGFKPGWMKGDGKRPAPINARGESVLERPMFRPSLGKGRCLIPATGFYEWAAPRSGRAKQPWYFALSGGTPFGFAGLWTTDREGEPTCAIVTTSANELVGRIHDRMPVILAPDAEADWLDPSETDPSAVLGLLAPYPAGLMEAWPVSPAVNAATNDGPELVRPLA